MSFETLEESTDGGRPLELLKVSFMTNHYCYTTAEAEVEHDGMLYLPMPWTHGDINPTGDVAKSSIIIKVPMDCEIGEMFRIQPPPGVVTATIFVRHVDDDEVKVMWKGRLINSEWVEPWLELTSESAFSSLQRLGVRRKYSSQCPHPIYSIGDGMCNADRELFKREYAVTSFSGSTIHCSAASEKPTGFFDGGEAVWMHTEKGYLERRMVIHSDVSGAIEITIPPQGLVPGQVVTLYPGCNHSTDCKTKFFNSLNFGGQPYIPQKNPFGGSTLY